MAMLVITRWYFFFWPEIPGSRIQPTPNPQIYSTNPSVWLLNRWQKIAPWWKMPESWKKTWIDGEIRSKIHARPENFMKILPAKTPTIGRLYPKYSPMAPPRIPTKCWMGPMGSWSKTPPFGPWNPKLLASIIGCRVWSRLESSEDMPQFAGIHCTSHRKNSLGSLGGLHGERTSPKTCCSKRLSECLFGSLFYKASIWQVWCVFKTSTRIAQHFRGCSGL